MHAAAWRTSALARQLGQQETVQDAVAATPCSAVPAVAAASKVVTAAEAAALIPDGVWITVAGYVGAACPELLLRAVRARFDSSGQPQQLGLLVVAAAGDFRGRGVDVLAAESLVDRMIYGWIGTCPGLLRLVRTGTVQAWNFPFGIVSQMFREVAAGRQGPISRIGLGTTVDPRQQGGKANAPTTQDRVHLVQLGGRELLWYEVPERIGVALLRGTSADPDGNVSFEKEAVYADQLDQAMAAHNSGGLVIVQVERLVERGSLTARGTYLPGALVDKVVVAPPELHLQTFEPPATYSPSLSGRLRLALPPSPPLPLDERRIIAHRAMLEIDRPGLVVKLGVGMPQGVATMLERHAQQSPSAASVQLITDVGAWGGRPGDGLAFGAAYNAAALVPTGAMTDFIHGRGIDVACLGMGEVDAEGNVNVTRLGGELLGGCGAFMDINQTAAKLVFMGTFTSGGLQVAVHGGWLAIQQEGRTRKFVDKVEEIGYAAASAAALGQQVVFVTERAVFRLAPEGGLVLEEVAPGVDVERQVLALMGFRPRVAQPLRTMDPSIFSSC